MTKAVMWLGVCVKVGFVAFVSYKQQEMHSRYI